MGREVLRGLGPDLPLGQHSVVPVSVGGGEGTKDRCTVIYMYIGSNNCCWMSASK